MTRTLEANRRTQPTSGPLKNNTREILEPGHNPRMPDTLPPEISPAELRFRFLFPASQVVRFALYAPDVLDLRWACFDRVERLTIGYGATPEDAVDQAILTHSKSK
jgi:hypothetical protein